MKRRIASGVTVAWILAGVMLGAQNVIGAAVRGGQSVALGTAIRGAMIQTLPWIPVTLVVIALAVRFPLSRAKWRRHLAVHLVALMALAVVANALLVLGYWLTSGNFGSAATLAREGARWAVINSHVALLVYAAVLGITQMVVYYRRTRERELRLARVEGQLARAHVQALTAQIRPHFLFNTLHTMGQLWRSGRSDDADAVLDHLGSVFHRVQRMTSRTEVPLFEELELVREYLAIEQARFRDRLRVSIDAAPETLGCLVPPLILQPLVENAIRHGVSAISGASLVAVRAERRDERLTLTVHDDGPGMSAPSPMPGSGTGLSNTRERLTQLYGQRASLTTADAADGGAVVRVDLPAVAEPGLPADAYVDSFARTPAEAMDD